MAWQKQGKFKNTIIMLGGFHIIMTCLMATGQHLEGDRLKEVWVESEVYVDTTAGKMMSGDAYDKAVCDGHTLAVEALWRILWAQFESWCDKYEEPLPIDAKRYALEVPDALKGHDDSLQAFDII